MIRKPQGSEGRIIGSVEIGIMAVDLHPAIADIAMDVLRKRRGSEQHRQPEAERSAEDDPDGAASRPRSLDEQQTGDVEQRQKDPAPQEERQPQLQVSRDGESRVAGERKDSKDSQRPGAGAPRGNLQQEESLVLLGGGLAGERDRWDV